MYHVINSFDDVISELTISDHYLSFYTSDYMLHFIDKKSSSEYKSLKFERDSNYILKDHKLYISNDSELCILDIDTNLVLERYESGKQYISTLGDNLFLASSYIRSEKKYENLILNYEKQTVFEIIGEFGVNDSFNSFLFLINREKDKIAVADIRAKRILWDSILKDKVNGTSIIRHKFIIVPLTQSTMKIDLETGNILWNMDISLNYFTINEEESKIYSLSDSTFKSINIESGALEIQRELELQIPAHLTYYTDGYLYFSGYKGVNATRIFGAVDVKTGEIVFTQTIETQNGGTNRGCYDKPIVVGDRLYIRDQQKTLYIFEKQNIYGNA